MSISTGQEIWTLAEKHSRAYPGATTADAVIDSWQGERPGDIAAQTSARSNRVVFDAPAVN